jgi:hypothetical protein
MQRRLRSEDGSGVGHNTHFCCENGLMTRVAVFRDGNKMTAMIGPDLAAGIAGFGETVPLAMHELADAFDRHAYQLSGNGVGVEVFGKLVSVTTTARPSEAIRQLARLIDERGYCEHDFQKPDWDLIAAEPPVVPGD